MSRHRLVKNLTEDDYYDDYYDDDYYEEDEVDDEYAPPSKSHWGGSNTTSNSASTASIPSASTASAFPAMKPVTPKVQMPSVGVTKPPPGWGKPSAQPKGPTSPPPGWGKPSGKSNSVSISTPKKTPQSKAGVSAPPPGWEKPSPAKGGVSSPPPGWGKPGGGKPSNAQGGVSSPPPGWGKPGESSPKKTPARSNSPVPSRSKSPKPKPTPRKPLPNVLKDTSKIRSQLAMVVIGHVDAGKSTLMGQILVQVGQVTQRTVASSKFGNQLAWLLDEDESERQRGITMQIATKCIKTPQHDLIVLDAPGHAELVPVMITGAAHADVALLVIAATTGEFESGFFRGQTKEHVLLARGLGVSQVLVAINKLDVIEWDRERYDYIQKTVRDYLIQQNFAPKRIRFVPVSGVTGANVGKTDTGNEALHSWYKDGQTLLKMLDGFQPANRHVEKPMRFILSDVYTEGKNTIVRGRVVQGYLQSGDKLVVLPIGDTTTVTRVEHLQPPTILASDDPKAEADRLSIAMAGDTVELVLNNIDPMRISTGNLLVHPSARPPVALKARGKLLVMDQLTVPIIRGAQVLFHMHSIDIPAVVSKLISTTNRDGSVQKQRPRALTKGVSANVELTLGDRICMEPYADCRALGRFVLRRGGDTIAVGIIDEVLL